MRKNSPSRALQINTDDLTESETLKEDKKVFAKLLKMQSKTIREKLNMRLQLTVNHGYKLAMTDTEDALKMTQEEAEKQIRIAKE